MMYLAAKWLHFVSLISWMAGILYLYRLLVYLRERGPDSKSNHELLGLMAHRLYRYITIPAMTLTWIAGLTMISLNPMIIKGAGWLHTKILLVVLLTGSTHYAGAAQKRLRKDPTNGPTGKTFRILNEIPTLLMLAIAGLAVFRWF